ncbi:MAG: hypothetical protein KCHDKBKB_00127 [Elusimicrobia bacterium]|nr:hypothetical protein [Elusimicrobiota bacterium]
MAKPPHVDLETWRSLYDAALAYAQQRPWDVLSDQDLFAVRSPLSDETLYACTIGQERISFGLLVFRGEEGYASYRWIAESGSKPDVDGYIARQNQITLEFVQKKELDNFDRKVIGDLGWAKLRSPVWPQFRSRRPFEPFWYLDENEALLLTLALVCGLDFIGRIDKGKISLPMPPEQIPTYEIPENINGDISKAQPKLTWTTPPIHRPLPARPLPIDQERIRHIIQQTKPYGGAWEADISTLKAVINGGERPIIPLLFLVADQASGFILGSNVSQEFGEPHKVMADGLLNAMEKNQMRPSSILVKKGTFAATLAPLAKALGTPISEAKRLPMIDTARRAMKKHFLG